MHATRLTTGSKINLWLKVLPVGSDGFHPIETVFHSVDLCDVIEVTPLDRPDIEVAMSAEGGDGSALPDAEDNIVTTAIRMLQERTGFREGLSVSIAKRIPIAAGLAGGSGNAAGVMLAVNRSLGLGLSAEELASIGTSVGSDVPFCLRGGTMKAGGRGEVLEPCPQLDAWFVLGISEQGLATAEVYRRWDAVGATSDTEADAIVSASSDGNLAALAEAMSNDLEPVVVSMRPELAEKKVALGEAGALKAMVSGSGPTVFGLCASREAALDVSAGVADLFDRVEVVRSTPRLVEFESDSGPPPS